MNERQKTSSRHPSKGHCLPRDQPAARGAHRGWFRRGLVSLGSLRCAHTGLALGRGRTSWVQYSLLYPCLEGACCLWSCDGTKGMGTEGPELAQGALGPLSQSVPRSLWERQAEPFRAARPQTEPAERWETTVHRVVPKVTGTSAPTQGPGVLGQDSQHSLPRHSWVRRTWQPPPS